MIEEPIADTSEEMLEHLLVCQRKLSYEARLKQLNDLIVMSRKLVLARIHADLPHATDGEILKIYAEQLHSENQS